MTRDLALKAAREAASTHRPGLVGSDGKLAGDGADQFIMVHTLADAIDSHAPYEAAQPGCDRNRTPRLKSALKAGFSTLVGVWDSGFEIAVSDDGKWTTI